MWAKACEEANILYARAHHTYAKMEGVRGDGAELSSCHEKSFMHIARLNLLKISEGKSATHMWRNFGTGNGFTLLSKNQKERGMTYPMVHFIILACIVDTF